MIAFSSVACQTKSYLLFAYIGEVDKRGLLRTDAYNLRRLHNKLLFLSPDHAGVLATHDVEDAFQKLSKEGGGGKGRREGGRGKRKEREGNEGGTKGDRERRREGRREGGRREGGRKEGGRG